MAHPDSFQGFPENGVQFLRDLSANNEKAWFEAHKQTYHDAVQTPALTLVTALGERLQVVFPAIGYDTRLNGSGSLMRMYRDTRFSTDKSPYKTNVAMMFMPRGFKRMEAPGFGLQITPESVDLVAGIFQFSPAQLELYRQAVLHERSGTALVDAMAQIQLATGYTLGGTHYKRVPQGYPADHPRGEWLKFTALHVYSPSIPLQDAQHAGLLDIAMKHFQQMSPVYIWLMKVFYAEQQ